ncbi:MAG: hypothetical protein ACHBN1_27110 [Heteroscytonema crispum UTEX LB 1556]
MGLGGNGEMGTTGVGTTNHQPQRGDARSSLPRSAPPVANLRETLPGERPFTTNNQRDRASPVLGGKLSRSTRFTTNHQQPTTNH